MLLKNLALAKQIAADYATGNFTQQELSKKYNVPQQTLSKWLRELAKYDN